MATVRSIVLRNHDIIMNMNFTKLAIPDVVLIEPRVFGDDRGYFMETYHQKKFMDNGIDVSFVQDNFSYSIKGILRGIHYQLAPYAQDKLVRVVQGEVFDVAVDLRKNSSTFGQWVGEYLSEDNKKALFIPKGFGHGFCVVSDNAKFEYKCSDIYSPEHDRSIAWNDSDIAIDWPISDPIVSDKDLNAVSLSKAEINF